LRYSATLYLTSALDVVGGQRHAPAALPPGKTRYPMYRRLGGPKGRSGQVRKISPSQDRPARRQSLYGLSYPGPLCLTRQHHYLPTVPINPFRPNPCHSATDSLSDSVERFLAGPHLLGRKGSFFHRGPNPLSAALLVWSTIQPLRTALFWAVTQRVVVIHYRRFGTTYRRK